MLTFESIGLWQRTLAANAGDLFSQERERLRSAFMSFRERSALLAAEIARDLPDFTVHDVTHLDALWQMADLIIGDTYELTPTEAFILGGAFLIHDLGNGLAAYPDGVDKMYASSTWKDALSLSLRKHLGRAPTAAEVSTVDEATKKATTSQVLRTLHAQQAEKLALVSWKDPGTHNQLVLIQDDFFRNNYGHLIGRIAHSHWWDIAKLKGEFDTSIGAPVGFPSDWMIDPLKIACLLRVADAAHIDARRAPPFVKALRVKAAGSIDHWNFQEKLQQPMRSTDRIGYSSAEPFKQSEATSWWLCLEALQVLDKELAGVDAMLADCGRPRFVVHGVQGAEDAQRLTRWVKTDGWSPVDTRIKATNVALLASRLGGSELYGTNPLVPLRELIQNAADAIRARRYLEKRPESFGEITVRIGSDSGNHWIEVSDNGVGMSESVITGSLLDFGSPFWNSERMLQELPGLASSAFEPTGKYGIGFFSLFMWGDHIQVTSRRYNDAVSDTRVLEFAKGLHSRPLLRAAKGDELLCDGGTTVRVWVGDEPESENGALYRPAHRRRKIEDICEWLCPAIDTNVYVQRGDSVKKHVIRASDWKTISGKKLIARVADDGLQSSWSAKEQARLIEEVGPNLRTVKNNQGEIVGRVAVNPSELHNDLGAITDGGFRVCAMYRIAGIFHGKVTTASRRTATPTVAESDLAQWASEQQSLIAAMKFAPDEAYRRAHAANTVAFCGGNIGDLPVAEVSTGWMSLNELKTLKPLPDEIIIVERSEMYDSDRLIQDFGEMKLNSNVFVCEDNRPYFVEEAGDEGWPDPASLSEKPTAGKSNQATTIRTLAQLWGATLGEVEAASSFSIRYEYVWANVAQIGGKPIERSVHIIRNPKKIAKAIPKTTKGK
jgi:hypothetical protein